MKKRHLTALAALALAISMGVQAQTLVNLGLVGVGRLSGDSFDKLGAGVDTLGGIFSGMWLDPSSVIHSNGTYHATVFGLPDRGFGDGLTDYHPRIHRLAVAITPYGGLGPVAQDQIVIVNTDTLVLTADGTTFTGYLPDNTNVLTHPQSLPGSVGGGKRSLDPEGIAFLPIGAGGSWYISDEYGPFIYRLDSTGALLGSLPLPEAFIPRVGTNYPRKIDYLTGGLVTVATDSGRYNNRGMEGLSITPDGKKLVACIQSPLTQDGENRNPSRNTRILVYDLDPASTTYHQAVAEYVHVLPLNAAEANNRHTPVSEILALSDTKYLILQRDSRGLGGDAGPLLYKRIVEVDASGASNILGTGYDLEKGAPGQISLPRAGLPSNVVAVTSRDLVDMLNPTQLAKYGLNLAPSNQNINTLSEKWEALAVIPLNDPAAPNDYLLLVGNDNDFRAPVVYHNGVVVGTNAFGSDNVLLAFRIGADATVPTVTCPTEIVRAAAAANCSLPNVTSSATASDNSAAPVTITQTPAPGSPVPLEIPVTVTVVATDAAGNRSAPCSFTVVVFDGPPALRVPGALTLAADANCSAIVPNLLTNSATVAIDNCSAVTLAQSPAPGTVLGLGATNVTITASDAVNNSVSAIVRLSVADRTAPAIACPADITANATDANGAVVTFAASSSDSCGSAGLVCVPASGATFPEGTTTVQCIATDGAGNTNTCTFSVIVVRRPPVAVISSEQLIDLSPEFENPVLLSCNWWNACLIADGWTSSDPEGGALTYLWLLEGDPAPFGAGPVITNCLEVGEHTILLVVTDPTGLTGTASKTIEVVTAPLAIDLLIEQINESHKAGIPLTRQIKRELTATLRVALGHASRERLRETQKALDAFEKKVRAQVAKTQPAAAAAWIRWSQAVSEGMEKCIKPSRKDRDHDDKKDADGDDK